MCGVMLFDFDVMFGDVCSSGCVYVDGDMFYVFM